MQTFGIRDVVIGSRQGFSTKDRAHEDLHHFDSQGD